MASICFVLFFFRQQGLENIAFSLGANMTKACLRADVSYFLCCTRATKEIGDVYTQARLKRVRDLIQSIIQDYNNDEQEKYINLYKLINFYYGRHHYL